MEGWSRQANRDCDVLMGIVALLVSLARFADRAGELCGRRRGQLLQLLCYAEAVGCDFILGLMPASSICCDDTDLDGDPEPPVADAARLAAGLRVLALVLYTTLLRCAARSRAVVRLDAAAASQPCLRLAEPRYRRPTHHDPALRPP